MVQVYDTHSMRLKVIDEGPVIEIHGHPPRVGQLFV